VNFSNSGQSVDRGCRLANDLSQIAQIVGEEFVGLCECFVPFGKSVKALVDGHFPAPFYGRFAPYKDISRDGMRNGASSPFSGEEVDGEVEEGEEAAEGGGGAADALEGLVVAHDAVFDGAEAGGLADAHDLLHLGLQDGEVGEDLSFKICHFVLLGVELPPRGADGGMG
jgi:hypothetical protein